MTPTPPQPVEACTTARWDLEMTALSSITHRGDATGAVTALFRREKVILPDRTVVWVPIISGNSFRGVLRRIGERLLRNQLGYSDLPLPAAHTLLGAGTLAKSQAEPLSGRRLAELRRMNPLLAVFGGCAGGRIINGCLQVGKVSPIIDDMRHLLPTGIGGDVGLDKRSIVALESYSHLGVADPDSAGVDGQMRFSYETLAAGTPLHGWVQIEYPTAVEHSFLCEVLRTFIIDGHLGGRRAVGHGMVQVAISPALPDRHAASPWREYLSEHHDAATEALTWLT